MPKTKRKPETVDVSIDQNGSIDVFSGLTDEGQKWLDQNCEGGAPGGFVYIEHRYGPDVAQGAALAGLRIQIDGVPVELREAS